MMSGHQTFFKVAHVSQKIARRTKYLSRRREEEAQKALVRKRDKVCRFPLCGCRRFNLALHVAHHPAHHKGMGGHPRGDRNATALLVLVCAARHREHAVSLDRQTVKWEPLSEAGANGPIEWYVRGDAVGECWEGWVLLHREGEDWTAQQRAWAQQLATMER